MATRFTSSFIPTLHYFAQRLSEPSLAADLGPHAKALAALEHQLSTLSVDVDEAKRSVRVAHESVRVASTAVDATLRSLSVAFVASTGAPLDHPFGVGEPTPSTLRRLRPAAKAGKLRGVLQGRSGGSPAIVAAVAQTLAAIVALEHALDVATAAENAKALLVQKRNAVAAEAHTSVLAIKAYATLTHRNRPEATFLHRVPSLVRKGRRVRTKDADPSPPTGDKPVNPTA